MLSGVKIQIKCKTAGPVAGSLPSLNRVRSPLCQGRPRPQRCNFKPGLRSSFWRWPNRARGRARRPAETTARPPLPPSSRRGDKCAVRPGGRGELCFACAAAAGAEPPPARCAPAPLLPAARPAAAEPLAAPLPPRALAAGPAEKQPAGKMWTAPVLLWILGGAALWVPAQAGRRPRSRGVLRSLEGTCEPRLPRPSGLGSEVAQESGTGELGEASAPGGAKTCRRARRRVPKPQQPGCGRRSPGARS